MTDGPHILPESPEDRQSLAAEYALGVLSGPERAAVQQFVEGDAEFAHLVAEWEERLSPIADDIAPVTPPPRVWSGLQNRLFPTIKSEARHGLWWSLAFWRSVTLASIVVAGVLFAMPLFKTVPSTVSETLVATLESAEHTEKFVALYETGHAILTITALAPNRLPESDYELWLVEIQTAPVSLGIFAGDTSSQIPVPEPLQSKFVIGIKLAVSSEPAGGSPTGIPTGPVLALGTVGEL